MKMEENEAGIQVLRKMTVSLLSTRLWQLKIKILQIQIILMATQD